MLFLLLPEEQCGEQQVAEEEPEEVEIHPAEAPEAEPLGERSERDEVEPGARERHSHDLAARGERRDRVEEPGEVDGGQNRDDGSAEEGRDLRLHERRYEEPERRRGVRRTFAEAADPRAMKQQWKKEKKSKRKDASKSADYTPAKQSRKKDDWRQFFES